MRLQEQLLKEISQTSLLARGFLRAKSGRVFYNLMYRRKTRLFSHHVGVESLPSYEAATAAYGRLRNLFERYIDEMTAKTIRAIDREASKCKNQKSGSIRIWTRERFSSECSRCGSASSFRRDTPDAMSRINCSARRRLLRRTMPRRASRNRMPLSCKS